MGKNFTLWNDSSVSCPVLWSTSYGVTFALKRMSSSHRQFMKNHILPRAAFSSPVYLQSLEPLRGLWSIQHGTPSILTQNTNTGNECRFTCNTVGDTWEVAVVEWRKNSTRILIKWKTYMQQLNSFDICVLNQSILSKGCNFAFYYIYSHTQQHRYSLLLLLYCICLLLCGLCGSYHW